MGLGSDVWIHPSWLNHNAFFTTSEKTAHLYFTWLLEVLLLSFPITVDEEVVALQDWHQVIASGTSFYFNDLDPHDFFYHLSLWKASSSSYPMSTILSFTVLQLFYVRHSPYFTRIMLEIQQLGHLELHQLTSNWIKKKSCHITVSFCRLQSPFGDYLNAYEDILGSLWHEWTALPTLLAKHYFGTADLLVFLVLKTWMLIHTKKPATSLWSIAPST